MDEAREVDLDNWLCPDCEIQFFSCICEDVEPMEIVQVIDNN